MTIKVRVTAAAGLVTLLLAGCGAGQDAATARDLPSIPGVNLEDAGIAVRNVAVVFAADGYGAGDTAPVELWISNETDQAVQLVNASSEAAASVTLEDNGNVEVPPFGLVAATLALDGLRSSLGTAGAVPLELTFDNGASFTMNVPVAPPQQRIGEREPIDLDEDH